MGQQIIGQNGTPVLSKQDQFQHVVSTAITASLGLLAPGYKAVFFFLRDDHQHEIVLGNGTLRDVLNSIKEKVPAEELATVADTSGLTTQVSKLTDEAQAMRNKIRRAISFIDDAGGGGYAKGILKQCLFPEAPPNFDQQSDLRASEEESIRGKIIECLCNILACHAEDHDLVGILAAHGELPDTQVLELLEEWQERTPVEMVVVEDQPVVALGMEQDKLYTERPVDRSCPSCGASTARDAYAPAVQCPKCGKATF